MHATTHADHERIRTISFDTKSKTITIVGPFDPQRLTGKLRCKGGKVVRDVHIVNTTNAGGGGKPPPENMPDGGPLAPVPVKNGKNKNKEKAPLPLSPPTEQPPSLLPVEPAPGPPPEQMMPPLSPVHHPRPPDPVMSATVPQPNYVEEKPPRAELEPPVSPPPKEMPLMNLMELPMPVLHHYHPPLPPMKERPPPTLMMPACPARPLEQQVSEYMIPTVEILSWQAPPVGPCGCPCAPCYQCY